MPTTVPRDAGFGCTSYTTTPSGVDACPLCESLDYIHPREFLKPGEGATELAELLRECPEGYCRHCNQWLLPTDNGRGD